jgi:LPXTG-site transpeptidase (sortase) family protein
MKRVRKYVKDELGVHPPSERFIRLFIIRFLAYFALVVSTVASIAQFGPILGAELSYRRDQVLGTKYTVEAPSAPTSIVTSEGVVEVTPEPSPSVDSGIAFGSLLGGGSSVIKPVSTDYGIVIEKINANAKVVSQVDPANEKDYTKALQIGVAEAKGSTAPGESGNTFLFSHSTDAPWNIARFNAIFYLLRELEVGDKIIIFYQGKRFDYLVFDKTIAKPGDVSFITNRYDRPVLTLQTCDPPGTLLNRLIIRAKLVGS